VSDRSAGDSNITSSTAPARERIAADRDLGREADTSVVSGTEFRERRPPDLADLTRQLEEAEAEARAAQHLARLLRKQIQDEKRRLRRSASVISSGSPGRALSVGALAGVGAGISLALFVMVTDAILGNGFLDWLRYSAAIALGSAALLDSSPPTVLIVGLIVHLSLAGLYGAVFAVAARYITFLRRDLLVATTLFGLGIWILNFRVFSPWLFPWFDDSPVIVQFVAHTVFYGMLLGLILLEFTPSGGILASNRARQ
jgi:hypothetical protein